VLISPDSTMVVSTVVLWDVATGKSLRMLEGSDHGSTWLGFYGPRLSPDGTQVAEIGSDGAVWVWDVHTGKRLVRLQGIYSQITRGAFSPDSRHLISSGLRNVWLWDVATGENVRVFRGEEDINGSINAFSATFNPDGSLIAVGGVGYVVRVLDADTGQEIHKMQGEGTGDKNHSGIVDSLVFSPDGKLLASGGYSGATKVWDVAAGQQRYLLGGMVDPVSDLAFSLDGKLLARASGFDSIKTMLWDVTTGRAVCTLEDLAGSVVFSPDGSMLVTADTDKVLRLWDVKTCQQVRVLKGHTEMASGLAFSPDGRLLASGSGDNTLRLWDITTGNLLYKVDPVDPAAKNSAAVSYLTFSPDGTLLAVEHDGGDIWLFGIPKT
jgi:WD40 repeat protein